MLRTEAKILNMTPTVPRRDDNSTLGAAKVLKALSRLSDLHKDMTVLQVRFFLAVAASPGATQREIYEALDSNDSTGSRALALLSNIGGRKTAPLDLVVMSNNPNDRRERILTLSPKGARLMKDILADLD